MARTVVPERLRLSDKSDPPKASPLRTNPWFGPRFARVRQSAPSTNPGPLHMDIERLNQIGTTLADLLDRTEALRGYL